MPRFQGFENVPGPPEPRFFDRPIDKKRGPGEFAKDDSTSEKARAAHDKLANDLKAKRVRMVDGKPEPWPEGKLYAEPVKGDFTPENLPAHLGKFLQRTKSSTGEIPETVWLEHGPLDGTPVEVRRQTSNFVRTIVNPNPVTVIKNEDGTERIEPTPGFLPVEYVRTKRQSNEKFPIFEFKPAAAV